MAKAKAKAMTKARSGLLLGGASRTPSGWWAQPLAPARPAPARPARPARGHPCDNGNPAPHRAVPPKPDVARARQIGTNNGVLRGSAAAVYLRKPSEPGRVLLLKKAGRRDGRPGRWTTPGGLLDRDDKGAPDPYWQAMAREFCEETWSILPDVSIAAEMFTYGGKVKIFLADCNDPAYSPPVLADAAGNPQFVDDDRTGRMWKLPAAYAGLPHHLHEMQGWKWAECDDVLAGKYDLAPGVHTSLQELRRDGSI